MIFAPAYEVPSFLDWFFDTEQYEGIAYLDHGGRWTYGFGHSNLRPPIVKEGDTISLEDAKQLAQDDLQFVWEKIAPSVTTQLSDRQQNICASLGFNGGIGGFKKSDVLAMINNTEKKFHLLYAADLILEYKVTAKDRITGIRRRFVGLRGRRMDEAFMWKKDIPK